MATLHPAKSRAHTAKTIHKILRAIIYKIEYLAKNRIHSIGLFADFIKADLPYYHRKRLRACRRASHRNGYRPRRHQKAPKRWYSTTFSQKKAQIKHKIHIKRWYNTTF